MSIDKDTVRRVAHLARIALPEEKVAPMADELSGILGWIEQLQSVDVTDVAPMTSAVEAALPMRADEVTDGFMPDKIVANAPKTEDHFFVVPKVVE